MFRPHQPRAVKLIRGFDVDAVLFAGDYIISAQGATYHVHTWPTLAATGKPRKGGQAMAVSPDGTRVAIVSNASRAVVRDVASDELVCELPVMAHPPTSMAFSPDGTRLAVGLYEGFHIYVLATRKRERAVHEPTWRVVPSIAYSYDGALLATRSYDEVAIWNAATARRVALIEGTNDEPEPIAFLPDGSVVTAASDTALGVWNAGAWKKPARTSPKQGVLGGIAVAADGTFVTNGRDDGVRLWTRALAPKVIAKASGQANGIAISADGSRLVAAISDAIVMWSDGASRSKAAAPTTASAPTVATQIKGGRTIEVSTAKQLAAWIATTKWLANIGKPLATKGAKRIATLAAWQGPEQPTNEPIFAMPLRWVEDATDAANAIGAKAAISIGNKTYGSVFDRARKAVPFDDESDPISDPPNAAVLSAATTAQAAAMWLALGWPLPADLHTLLAWYGDGRWPCGFARAPKRGGTPLAIL